MTILEEWNGLGVSTIYEAARRDGLLSLGIDRVVPKSRAVGRARTVVCGQDDNLGVHVAIDRMKPGEILVATMPEPRPIALVGEVLAHFAKSRGAAGILVDAAVRDVDELAEVGLPIWSRWVTSIGAEKVDPGLHNVQVKVGDQVIDPGDLVVLDGDGVVRVSPKDERSTLKASRARVEQEVDMMSDLVAGGSTLDLMGLRGLLNNAD